MALIAGRGARGGSMRLVEPRSSGEVIENSFLSIDVSGQEPENVMARPHPISSAHPTERLVGEAPAIVALRAHIRQLVSFDTIDNPVVPTVLLQGETGTGKGWWHESFTRAAHGRRGHLSR